MAHSLSCHELECYALCATSTYNANSPHHIQAYTDGSKSEAGVGAVIAIYQDNNLRLTMKYRLNERCTDNQAEQIAILKALEHIQFIETGEKIILIYTDS